MKPSSPLKRIARFSILALLATAVCLSARPVPQNLGNGLDKIVESNLIQKGVLPAPKSPSGQTQSPIAFNGYATKAAARYAAAALFEAPSGRYLVEIMPNGRVPVTTLRASLQTKYPLISVQATDTKYAGHGVIESFVSIDDVPGIAGTQGVGSVILQLRPIHSAVTAQGVHQHRVNHVNPMYNASLPPNPSWDGTGMSIGVMSDSFDSQPSAEGGFTNANEDVATEDLPGTGNTVNSSPVVVVEDYNPVPGATNEGRAMCQIVHDIAPKAVIGFATADVGELGFANNIRSLGGLDPNQTAFKGDVVCDDVSYLDEPMFQDGIIAQGVNDVVAAGVTYCSSAANNWSVDGYESVYRPVANGSGLTSASNSALAHTNINLANVPPELYAGGFHNFDPSGDPAKQDIAQLYNSGSDALAFVFEWNDPFDANAPALINPPILEDSGDSELGAEVVFGPINLTAGNGYVITEMATGTPPVDDFDAIVAVVDPNGQTIIDQDTGVDEVVTFYPQISGNYTIHVHPFAINGVPTHGPFDIKVNQTAQGPTMTQDFNVLYFDAAGNYIPDQSLTTNNLITNRPIENIIGSALADFGPQVQMVIARANTVPAPAADTYLKYVAFGNGTRNCGPAEYTSYLMPVTFGHSAAAGGNSVAAYAAFRPNVPEYFTSSGPVKIFFDANNNKLATPEVRLKPDIAAADGVNNTFFPIGPAPLEGGDSLSDPDDFPNFYGTSAASPHAAALAALVLQAHGGPGSLTPDQVKTIMQQTAFAHDLDPYSVSGTATANNGGTVSIVVNSDADTNLTTGANDKNSWNVSYTGPGFVKSLSFNAEATPQTGGNTTGGNFNGFTPADFLNGTLYKYTPGMVFTSKFLVGDSTGINAAVTHTRSNPAPPPSNPDASNPTEHEWTLSLTFADNDFTAGDVFRFNAGRLQQQDSTTPTGLTKPGANAPIIGAGISLFRNDASADLLGGSVLIPEDPNGTGVQPGMSFSGTIKDGANTYQFSGRLNNKIGRAWTPLDGYGFINVEAATALPIPVDFRLTNLSGRLNVGISDNIGVGGFIISGGQKKVLIRARGPSLAGPGFTGVLADPALELHDSSSAIASNDNWITASNTTDIAATGLAPTSPNEAAILITLPAGDYTVFLVGSGGGTGIGTVEMFDLGPVSPGEMGNLSVRANVGTGDNVLIDGVIVSGTAQGNVLFRGLGPSLHDALGGGGGELLDPYIELHNANGDIIEENDDWTASANAGAIGASGLAPGNTKEAAIIRTLGPGNYTLILRGATGGSGIGLAEVYKLQ